jgi:ethanolamine ammonia-lyase large subunit
VQKSVKIGCDVGHTNDSNRDNSIISLPINLKRILGNSIISFILGSPSSQQFASKSSTQKY